MAGNLNSGLQLSYYDCTTIFQCMHFRVKKPDEFNRPRIPYSQRVVKARSSKFLSKKVTIP
jgi:hypothetical protein